MVKNIADFGAFVDLGGIDGLLHITDMSWGRINHPREMVKIDQEIEVKILNIDREKEKIALGLKQKTPSPWENIESKYPVGSARQGRGGQHHVLRRVRQARRGHRRPGAHHRDVAGPSASTTRASWCSIGDEVEVVVLDINKDKQEISLGMKQAEANPWDEVAEKYPPGTVVDGTVRNLTNYGAFIEIEEGIDGLLHVSDMSWTQKISHPTEMLKKGDRSRVRRARPSTRSSKRIALGLKQLHEDPWADRHSRRSYQPGQIVTGKVTKITNFGVFVELEHGPRRPAAHLRTGRPQGREPGGRRQGRRGGRGQDPPRRHRRAQDRPEPQTRPRRKSKPQPKRKLLAKPTSTLPPPRRNRSRGASAATRDR